MVYCRGPWGQHQCRRVTSSNTSKHTSLCWVYILLRRGHKLREGSCLRLLCWLLLQLLVGIVLLHSCLVACTAT